MLSTDRAAERDRRAHEIGERRIDARTFLIRVPEEVDVQVAVAGVPVGEVANLVALADAIGFGEQIADARARDDDVFGELVLGEPLRGRRKRAARLPEPISLRLV